jgi:VWFA-related protein
MRPVAIVVVAVCPVAAQFKSTVPLVVAAVTVTDSKGAFIDGLSESDLILCDNNVPQTIHVEAEATPISLLVLIQATTSSSAIVGKLRQSGPLFNDLLAGEDGETALLAFSGAPRLIQDFTTDSRPLTHALHGLRFDGDRVALLDGLREGLHRLEARDQTHRRVMLVIAERRDRSSKTKLADLLRESQLQNTAIYWLTYSTFLAPFTARRKRVWDTMTDEQKSDPKRGQSGPHYYPLPEEEGLVPSDMAPGSYLSVFTALAHQATADAAALLSQATSGRTFAFLKQSGLEEAIQAVGREVHRQYIVTFQPKPDKAGVFHALRAQVKGRADLQVRTRTRLLERPVGRGSFRSPLDPDPGAIPAGRISRRAVSSPRSAPRPCRVTASTRGSSPAAPSTTAPPPSLLTARGASTARAPSGPPHRARRLSGRWKYRRAMASSSSVWPFKGVTVL